MDKIENSVKEIADLVREGAGGRVLHVTAPDYDGPAVPLIVRPTGNGTIAVESAKRLLDEYRPAPERRRGTAKAFTLASFIALANRHKDADSALFAVLGGDRSSLTAVFDYHTVEHAPRFCQHRAVYQFPLSDEWKLWTIGNGVTMTQGNFSAFIEDHIAELAAPSDGEIAEYEPTFKTKIALPSDMMTLSRGMAVSVEGKASEARVLQSGEVQVSYEEVHKDGRGEKLLVPGLFVVSIPLFVGGADVRLLTRLRYRVNGGKISWLYQLYRPELVMREVMSLAAEKAAEDTGLPMYEVEPEA
jgi:uncharacterized protein YfdQ (DUF2303 family)